LAKQRRPVGWVGRSETHHPFQHDNAAEAMGFTSFYPSCALACFDPSWPILKTAVAQFDVGDNCSVLP
jgi:hypothetical protein